MGVSEIEAFLTDWATNGKVAASTQNQAFGTLLFLYRHVLRIELPEPIVEASVLIKRDKFIVKIT